jgi:uncharacterized membrane protein
MGPHDTTGGKASFMAGYWSTVLLNIAAVAAWVGKLLPAGLPGS